MSLVLNTSSTIHIEWLAEFHTIELWPWPGLGGPAVSVENSVESIGITFDTPSLLYNNTIRWEFVTYQTPTANGLIPVSWSRSTYHILPNQDAHGTGYIVVQPEEPHEDR